MRVLAAAILSLVIIRPAHACSDSQIMRPTPFMGNNGEIFVLADGSVWEVKYEYEYMYEHHPLVVICPEQNVLIVDGKRLNVERLSATAKPRGKNEQGSVIRDMINGYWQGWQGNTIVKLMNGQVWEQIEPWASAAARMNPEVLIINTGSQHHMQVDGESSAILVKRLR